MKKVEKKVVKDKSRESLIKKILKRVGAFFNSPKPIIVFLIILVSILILYIYKYNTRNTIFVGRVNEEKALVKNIHYFTNGDMNYFYADHAMLTVEDKKVYSFEIGYYVEDENKELVEFAVRSNSLEKAASLSKIVSEQSGWNYAEPGKSNYMFTKDVLKNMDKLHFVIKATTVKDSTDADIYIDCKVEEEKITK